jgi:phospholipid-translocating ATPase
VLWLGGPLLRREGGRRQDCLGGSCLLLSRTNLTVQVGKPTLHPFPANVIRNQKYSLITFVPLVLYNQFKFFLNLYFLVMACSQFIPVLRIGYLYTYWVPLGFVISVTMVREAFDDIRRWQRDREVNLAKYARLTERGRVLVTASRLQVGDVVEVGKGVRAPADLVLLRTTESSGACFIRTDQLDGETDWKLRLAIPHTQRLVGDEELLAADVRRFATISWFMTFLPSGLGVRREAPEGHTQLHR